MIGLALLSLNVLLPIPAMGQNIPSSYAFLIGTGVLCDVGDSSACPAVVKSNDGSSFELAGAGVLDVKQKTVTAAGTFVHKSPDGNTVEAGIWTAKDLVTFQFYGFAPGALMHAPGTMGSMAFGLHQMPMAGMPGAQISPTMGGPVPAGGLAVLHIRLLPISGFARNATLQVNCALGKVPDEHPTEGIRLTFDRGQPFDQEVSGRTMFLSVRPEPAAGTNSGLTQ